MDKDLTIVKTAINCLISQSNNGFPCDYSDSVSEASSS